MQSKNIKKWGIWIVVSSALSVLISNSKAHLPVLVYKLLGCSLIPYAYIFLAGLFCYRFFDEIVPYLQRYWWLLFLVYVPIRFTILKVIGMTGVNFGVNYDIFSALLLSLASIGAAYRLGEIRFKHELSYGIFLWHMVVINIGCELTKKYEFYPGEILVMTGATVAISIVLALVSQKWVSIPVLRFFEKYDNAARR